MILKKKKKNEGVFEPVVSEKFDVFVLLILLPDTHIPISAGMDNVSLTKIVQTLCRQGSFVRMPYIRVRL